MRGVLLRLWGVVWRIGLYVLLFAVFGAASLWAVVALGLPEAALDLAGSAASLVAALLAAWVMMHGVERRPLGAMGFAPGPAAPRECVVGTGIGGAFLGLTVLLIAVTGGVHWVPDAGTVSGYVAFAVRGLVFFAMAAAVEEVLFRGYPFQVLERAAGPVPAALVTSLVFAVMHAGNPNVEALGLANIFLAGVMLAAAYLRTRSLWFATAVHLGWNWVMSTLLDLPVSGWGWNTPLYTGVETGPDWWTGGSFGPEAGLAATLVIVVGTVWLLRTPRLRESPDVMRLRPLVYESPSVAEGLPPKGEGVGAAPESRDG